MAARTQGRRRPVVQAEETGEFAATTEEEARRQRSRRWSKWTVGINTNIRTVTDADSVVIGTALRNAMRRLATTDNIEQMLVFRYPASQRARFDEDVFEDVSWQWSVERGENARGKRIHSHSIVRFVHHSNIILKPKNIREVFNPIFKEELTALGVDASRFKNSAIKVTLATSPEGYLNKPQATRLADD